jgi:hypothetical protein
MQIDGCRRVDFENVRGVATRSSGVALSGYGAGQARANRQQPVRASSSASAGPLRGCDATRAALKEARAVVARSSSGLLFTVSAQSREIGIKLALGASPSQARWKVIQTALRLTSIGGAVGVLTGMAIGTLMDHQLFEVSPIDPLAVVTVLGLLLALSWCSALVPATRASRIDPAAVLRNT